MSRYKVEKDIFAVWLELFRHQGDLFNSTLRKLNDVPRNQSNILYKAVMITW